MNMELFLYTCSDDTHHLENDYPKSAIFCRSTEITSLKRHDFCLPVSSTLILMKFIQKILDIIRWRSPHFQVLLTIMTELWRHMIFEVTSKRDEVIHPSKMLEWSKTLHAHLGAVQKLRNGQREEGAPILLHIVAYILREDIVT